MFSNMIEISEKSRKTNKKPVLSFHFSNMSYLANDVTGEATAPITRLVRDEATDNFALVLELIAGGGANRRLLGYLFAIAVFHNDKAIADRALGLLKQHGSEDTLKQALKLKEGSSYYYNEEEYLGRYRNPEFDLFDFLLARKMCHWHRSNANRSDYHSTIHQTLQLANYPEKVFSPAIATLDFVRYITLPANKEFELEASFEHLKKLPIESVFMENVRIDTFPTILFALPKLRTLSLKRGTYRQPKNKYMAVPNGGPHGCLTLEKLTIDGYSIEGENRLGAFPNLRQALLSRCALSEIAFLQQSVQLEYLDVRHNLLEEIPEFLSGLTALRDLNLGHNPLKKIHLDVSKMNQLEDLKIELKIQRPASLYYR
jgi:hypothetical protein